MLLRKQMIRSDEMKPPRYKQVGHLPSVLDILDVLSESTEVICSQLINQIIGVQIQPTGMLKCFSCCLL